MDKGKAARIAQSQTGKSLATGKKPKHPIKAANEDESEVEVSPARPMTSEERAIADVLKSVRKGNSGIAIGYEKLLTPDGKEKEFISGGEGGLLVKARQPVDPSKPPRASGGPRAERENPYEQIAGEHPALLRKKDTGELYIQTIAHPNLPKETNIYTHGVGGPDLTPKEVEELLTHFRSGKSGYTVTKPHLNSQGKPTPTTERYPKGIHHLSRGFYRIGYDPEHLMDDVGHRLIKVSRVHAIAPYNYKNVKDPSTIPWVEIKPTKANKLSTSNEPFNGKNMKKTVHQRIMDLCHAPVKSTELSNKEVALGNRIRAWRNYSYRKLGLPKFGLANEEDESDDNEDLKERFLPHSIADDALDTDDYSESLQKLKAAGELANQLLEIGMAGDCDEEGVGMADGAPKPPSVTSEPKLPSISGRIGTNVGSQAVQSGAGYVGKQAKQNLGAMGINFSNDIALSNIPSSQRITRSPGNQILFELRQRKSK